MCVCRFSYFSICFVIIVNMPKSKKNKMSKPLKKLIGKGDYDIVEQPKQKASKVDVPAAIGALSKGFNSLDSRIEELEKQPAKDNPYSTVGSDIGSLFGMGKLGKSLGGAVGKFLGHGDYVVQSNSLIPGKNNQGPGVPVFQKDGKRGIRVTEREFLGDIISGSTLVNGSSSFNIQTYRINPGLNSTFPWLSAVAQQFEEWEPLGIVFEFVSTSSEFNGSSQGLGVVVAATDYDVYDQPFFNKIQMESEDYSCSTKASVNMMHGIECAKAERESPVMYIRASAIPTGATAAQYDLGNFQIATQGMSVAGVNVGELWVSYDIALYKKNLFGGQLGNDVLTSIIIGTTSISTSNYFSTAPTQTGNMFLTLGGATITFPKWLQSGVFMITYEVDASSITSTVAFSLTTNCTTAGVLPFAASNGTGPTVGISRSMIIRITGPSAVVTLTSLVATSITAIACTVTQVSGATPYPTLTSDVG